MRLGMTYMDIIKHSPRGNEAKMWDAVERVDSLVEQLRKDNPKIACEFLMGEYEAMNGKHINEWLAKEMVGKMWHEEEGERKISGEAVTPDEAMKLVESLPLYMQNETRWDAYVAANAFMHDLAKSGMSKEYILKCAKCFWFHDDDMGDNCHKVYWYFKDWIYD